MAESPVRKRLRQARQAANLSQKKLGIQAGMDQFSASARMNHYEMGRHAPDYTMLKRIGNILGVPVAYFYAEADELAEMIILFSKLRKDGQNRILNQLMELKKQEEADDWL